MEEFCGEVLRWQRGRLPRGGDRYAEDLPDFLSAYRPQLNLYALAIDKRFAPKKVTYKGIYSLELGRLIEA